MFETLNERGLDLSQADLIKNKLLEHAKEEGEKSVDRISKQWTDILTNYEEQSPKKLELPQIIQFSYTYRHKLVKKEEIFETISKNLNTGVVDTKELTSQFRADSKNWRTFLLGDLPNWSKEIEEIQYAIFDPLWKSHCTPFIMATFDLFSDEIDELKKYLKLCENFLFREGLIGKASVSSLQEVFSIASHILKSEKNLDSVARHFKENSSDIMFTDLFKTFKITNMKQGFYITWKLEKNLSSKLDFRPADLNAAQHLEYIMPKKPNSDWNEIEKEESFNLYINRIGNLLSVPRKTTQELKHFSFNKKISPEIDISYKNSKLHLPKEIANNQNSWTNNGVWDFSSIEKRQNYLAEKYAGKIWSLDIK